MNQPTTPETRQSCKDRLNELDKNDMLHLTAFAEYRLMSIGRSSDDGEDLVQNACLAVARGLESDAQGRRPRPEDVQDKQSFLRYLKGVILSLLHGETKSRRIKASRQTKPLAEAGVGEEKGIILAAQSPDPAKEVEFQDLRNSFFSRLRDCVPKRLQPTLQGWEAVAAESDRIPASTFRKYVVELRHIARQIMDEIQSN